MKSGRTEINGSSGAGNGAGSADGRLEQLRKSSRLSIRKLPSFLKMVRGGLDAPTRTSVVKATPRANGRPQPVNAVVARSRRGVVLKRPEPVKAAPAVYSPLPNSYLFYQGSKFTIGDIVSVTDVDGGTYYAQIRGFLTQQFAETSVVLTWLLPTIDSPLDGSFDPTTFVIGPEEDIPRALSCVQFVSHCPSRYYMDSLAPYGTSRQLGPKLVESAARSGDFESLKPPATSTARAGSPTPFVLNDVTRAEIRRLKRPNRLGNKAD